jgi:antitoxin (DNA-binding transcriptional repressor) of toxin-antitoxin stability system
MKRIDLDDLPPKIAALLSEAEAGEEVLLVQAGAVVGRLTAGGPALGADAEPPVEPEAHAKEVFELFRSSVEDEF